MAITSPPDPPADATTLQEARQWRLWTALTRGSRDLIYIAMQRAGGDGFGAPYELGLPSLTARLVSYFKQKGYFAFSSVERLAARDGRNKFTRHGAAPYRGTYRTPPKVQAGRGRVDSLLHYLRDNRFFYSGPRGP